MRLSDLLKLAISNLKRRKTRTILTVLGVVIGTASIVVMMSLGLGMSAKLTDMYASTGSLTTISVYGNSADNVKARLTDETLKKKFEAVPHVTGTSPELSVRVSARSGPYEGDFNIVGVTQQYMEQLKLKSGSVPPADQPELSLVYGNLIGYSAFHKGKDYGKTGTVDPQKDTIFISFPAAKDYSTTGTSSSDSSGDEQEKPQKKYIIKTAGVIVGGEEDYSEYCFSVFADIDTLKTFLKKIYKKALVPNPQTNKNGKPYPFYIYEQAYVFVDDMKNVSTVQKQISDMGFQCSSSMEWLEQSQKTMNMVQLVLGGIGAVSLLVAAIGIMNTMMMSIYERNKEIGVMKVLGCDMGDIRNMFLAESGFIGLLGGIVGLGLSEALSFIINSIANRSAGGGLGMLDMSSSGNISIIPIWLVLFALLFSIAVGSLAGYIPSLRAMKLSPLAAIRNE